MAKPKYTLVLNEQERDRYRMMAAYAADDEAADWAAAGIVPGARVADIGCGPGATLALIADRVAPDGVADGVDGNPEAIECAIEELGPRSTGTARVGSADASGLTPGTYDVVMCRHVLAHNGGREQQIVDHLVSLARPGGAVYVVDVDMTGNRLVPDDPDHVLFHRYAEFHASQGNDPSIGTRLGVLLETAGCAVERYHGNGRVLRLPLGVRPPMWAARDAMVASGVVNEDDVARTGAALDRMEASETSPWIVISSFVAVGRVPGG